jgi:glucose-6-phosphate dehydrogenase assembly protein OpcA
MTAEEERTRLIGEIARVLREGPVPDEARAAALTLIGWLARRMPGEPVSHCDIGRCRGAPPREARLAGVDYEGPRSGRKPRTSFDESPAFTDTRPRSAR